MIGLPAAIPKPRCPSAKQGWLEADNLEKLAPKVPPMSALGDKYREAIRAQVIALREPLTLPQLRGYTFSEYAMEAGERALAWKNGASEDVPYVEWLKLKK